MVEEKKTTDLKRVILDTNESRWNINTTIDNER